MWGQPVGDATRQVYPVAQHFACAAACTSPHPAKNSNVPHRLLYFILNIAFVIPVKNLGSFITTTFITQTSSAYNLHPHQRAAQYYYQGTLNHGKEPHRQHQCRKNPCYVCKGENSARPTSFFLQKAGTPFQYHCTKESAFLLQHNYAAGASPCPAFIEPDVGTYTP